MMNGLETSLREMAQFLDAAGIPYMVHGGFANLVWGRPRLTQDLDITILIGEDRLPDLIDRLKERWPLLAPDPIELARQARVIPVAGPGNVRVDLVLAGLPYEEAAIQRAVPVRVAGTAVKICTPEDLILTKIVSERPRDLEDVEGVILRRAQTLDRAYLAPRIEELSRLLDRPGIRDFYRGCLQRAGMNSSTP